MNDTAVKESTNDLRAGTEIEGRYRVGNLLGRGGFASVYLGHHLNLDRPVALKVLDLPTVAMNVAPFVDRFLREGRVAARIQHPNVVGVYDYGIIDNTQQPYIAMEFLEGHDLEEELKKNGPMAPARIHRLFVDALDALEEAHRLKVIHKDLKPSNIYLVHPGTRKEKLVVLDFGIARVYGDGESKLTQTGGFAGTPAYLAPEYIQDQIVTPALDVYQMGLIIIEMLTGKPAVVAANSMGYMFAHCSGQLSVSPEVFDSPLGAVIQKATLREHTERHQSAAEFRDALREAEEGVATMPDDYALSIPMRTVNAPDTTGNVPVPNKDETPKSFMAIVALLLIAILCVAAAIVYKVTQEDPIPKIKTEPIALVVPEKEEPVEAVSFGVALISNPDKATVLVDNAYVGRTPMTITVDPENAPKTILFEKDGFLTRKVQPKFVAGQSVTVQLEKKPEPKKVEPVAAKKKPWKPRIKKVRPKKENPVRLIEPAKKPPIKKVEPVRPINIVD